MGQKYTLYSLGLLIGDFVFLILALWATLLVRYGSLPSEALFKEHFYPFVYIFGIWLVVYFIYDLYRRQLYFFKQKILGAIFNAHVLNSGIAILFFYLIPYFNIAPKTNLFIFLFVSFAMIVFWRIYIANYLLKPKPETLFFACQGGEVRELENMFGVNSQYGIKVCEPVSDLEKIKEIHPDASVIAISAYGEHKDSELEALYGNLFSGLKFVNVERLYEDVFGRVPLSLISERWFLDHISAERKPVYDTLKRLIDILASVFIGFVFLIFFLPIVLLIKIFDGGSIFFPQERGAQWSSV